MHFIFGYGSLICADSRRRTGISGPAYPIEVKGISRKWSLHTPDWPATAVSAHKDDNSSCNGVYFNVDQENLACFDQREQGYQRIQLNWLNVQSMSDIPLPTQGTLWAYIGSEQSRPSENKPIMQSYLDVILNGCLDYGPDFTRRFTELTLQWDHLVDDRAQPTYPRPLRSDNRHSHIDRILRSHLPELWHSKRTHNQH